MTEPLLLVLVVLLILTLVSGYQPAGRDIRGVLGVVVLVLVIVLLLRLLGVVWPSRLLSIPTGLTKR